MALAAPPIKRFKSSFAETFDVLVGAGSNKARFTVHYEIITKWSAFFRAARSDRWTTNKSKPADLQEHEPETFEVYMHCLYLNTMPEAILFEPIPPPDPKSNPEILKKHRKQVSTARRIFSESRYLALVDLYILADHLKDPTTTNIAIDEIRRFKNSFGHPSLKVIDQVFSSTREKDGLRMLFVDDFVYESLNVPYGDLPKGFFQMVGERFLAANKADHIGVRDKRSKYTRDADGSDNWDKFDYYKDTNNV